MTDLHVGSRLSFKGDLCTLRYLGEVAGKKGQWLGVEWDDHTRGKHNGTFDGQQYFTCRSNGSHCASFLRPDAKFATRKTVHQALIAKYASNEGLEHLSSVRISGKTIEETGYDKIQAQQSNLEGLRTIILDHQDLGHAPDQPVSSLESVCPNAAVVDLGYNLFESLTEVHATLGDLRSLRALTLDGNRLVDLGTLRRWTGVTSLNLDHMLLLPKELASILEAFPHVKQLSASANLLSNAGDIHLNTELEEAHLNDNGFTDLADVATMLRTCSQVTSIALKHNRVSCISRTQHTATRFPGSVKEVDLSYNNVSSWLFFDSITTYIPGLQHLRLTGNPIYEDCRTPDGKAMDKLQVSMLVIARIGQLKMLNFTTVTEKDRLNAETFYLGLIAKEVTLAPASEEAEILARHPRFLALCEEYGPPNIVRQDDKIIDPNSIEANLVRCHIHVAAVLPGRQLPTKEQPCLVELPQTFSMYSVYSAVARRLEMLPSALRLTWETGERDPPDKGMPTHAAVIEEWDSDDEDEGPTAASWVDREVELECGSRPLVTMVDKDEVVIRVEVRSDAKEVFIADFLATK